MLLTFVRERELCPAMETSFALCFDGRFSEELAAAGATIHMLGAVRIREPLSVRRARRNLKDLLRRESFDVAVVHSCWSQAIFGQTVRTAGVPLVFYLHAPPNGRHWLERLAKRIKPNLVICNSKFTAESSSLLYRDVRSEIVYCPVSPPNSQPSLENRKAFRAELNTPNDAVVIIQVGRMELWKGHALHLQALGKLRGNTSWMCWIVGGAQRPAERKYVEELKNLAQQLGIAERVRFVGQRDDANNLLAAADMFCQPNIVGEPFGISFIEALYAGLPVVTCDIGAAREIVDDTCGIRVPTGNVESLAAALQELMQDADRRTRLGRGGPARANYLCDPLTPLQKFQSVIASLPQQRQAIA